MRYELRSATEDDYEFCYAVTKQNMLVLFSKHWGGWVDEEFRRGFHPGRVRIVLMDDEPAGFISVEVRDDAVYIENVQLSPVCQGSGIGTEILLRVARENDRLPLRLTTFVDNPARRLYERLGFKVLAQETGTMLMERRPGREIQADGPSRRS
jgi:ribosomal protein S18 acetylase RimI-like enzyme